MIRVLVGSAQLHPPQPGPGPLIVETNLDDLSPELVPDVVDACLAAGALDAWTTPVVMKRGRPGLTLPVMVAGEHEPAVAEAVLRHSTAIGLRVRRTEHRWALERTFVEVEVDGHAVRVKVGWLDGEVLNIKPEHRDCRRVADEVGVSVKAVWSAALAAAEAMVRPVGLPRVRLTPGL